LTLNGRLTFVTRLWGDKMNERIRELAEQAREYASDYVADCKHYGYYMEHNELEIKFEEKFAELIVRECAQFVEDKFDFIGDEIIVKEKMLEHFGVEE
jgi:hypothetical protein